MRLLKEIVENSVFILGYLLVKKGKKLEFVRKCVLAFEGGFMLATYETY